MRGPGDQGDCEGHGPRPRHHFVHRFLGGEGDRNEEGLREGQTSGNQDAVGPGHNRRGYSRDQEIGGDRNFADILTKYLASPELPVAELEGRHALAPQLQGKS